MEEKISVILVNYNGILFNDKCIKSILSSTIADRLQIVVVDNASTDNSLNQLHEHWDDNTHVDIIELDDNYGFATANNIGIQWSIEHDISYFLLLNNDTEIESDTIEQMLKCYEKNRAIIVPKILYADTPDIIWCAGGKFSPVIKKAVHRGINQKDKGQFEESCACTFANGCCMLLTSEIIIKTGFLDERFFLYYEDTEYSLRALENGIRIWYCSKAVVYHKVNGATKGNDNPLSVYYITRNWLICNKMHMNAIFYLFCFYFALNRIAWVVIWLFQGKKNMIKELRKGVSDFRSGQNGRRIL